MADAGANPRTLADLLLRGKPETAETSPQPNPEPNPEPRPTRASPRPQGQLDLLFGASAYPAVRQPAKQPAVPAPGAAQAHDEPTDASGTSWPSRSPITPPIPASGGPAARTITETTPETRRVWTVAALVTNVRQRLESGYGDVLVTGEVSNCRPAPSGHFYFTLRDGDAQISAVLFRRQAQLLRFALRDGMEVLARGRISMFEARGQLQLIAETLEQRGTGSLQLAFEQLKARLLAEGLFDSARKRPLPPFPQRIGVVTSPGGAVIHDIIKVIRRRHACLDLLIFPATVQGPECASTVAAGIRWFNRAATGPERFRVDLIVIARGGGSLEDLAGFNDEALARTIAASGLPVVSGVGHETDFTIADFVADLRAPTPSAAAELITAAQHRIEDRVATLSGRLHRAIRFQTVVARQRFTTLSADQILSRVRDFIERRSQRVDDLERRLEAATRRRLDARSGKVATLTHRLERLHPGETLRSHRKRLEFAQQALGHLVRSRIAPAGNRVHQAEARLHALSPYAVLRRGYALVYAEDGTLLRDAATAQPGSLIRARVARGSLTAQVTESVPADLE